MKIAAFKRRGPDSVGETRYRIGSLMPDGEVFDLTNLISENDVTAVELLNCFDLRSGFLEKAKAANSFPGDMIKREEIELSAPVPRPGKIICIGLNYRDHAEESGMAIPKSPVIFSKFTNCAIGARASILLPQASAQVDYEAE